MGLLVKLRNKVLALQAITVVANLFSEHGAVKELYFPIIFCSSQVVLLFTCHLVFCVFQDKKEKRMKISEETPKSAAVVKWTPNRKR